MTRRDEAAIAFFGTWMVTGLYLDGWAHNAEKPETFFSPWHGVLYSGFAAAVAYFGLRDLVFRRGNQMQTERFVTVGFALFVAGALGDFAWHEIFGIEVDLEALLSPTHLALMTGGLLMLGAPIRSAWDRADDAPTLRAFFPTVVAISVSVAVVSFFTMYVSAFRFAGLHSDPGFVGDMQEIHGVSAVLITNTILIGPTLLTIKRWRTPPLTFALMFGAVAFAMAGIDAFRFPLVVIAALVAGAFADTAALRLRPSPERIGAARAFGVLVPFALWSTWLVAVRVTGGITWAPELWTGVVILAMVTGLGLSILVFPPSRRGTVATAVEPETYATLP